MSTHVFHTTATEAEIEQITRLPMSWEEYLDLPDYYRTADGFEGRISKAEWWHGEAIIMMAPMRKVHSRLTSRLERLLEDSLTGVEIYHEVRHRLPDGVLVPDILVVEADGDDDPVFVNQVPLVVVEVLSPSTRTYDLFEKSDKYQAAGVMQYWIVDSAGWLVVRANTVDGWKTIATVDKENPQAQVTVSGAGVVNLNYDDIFQNLPSQ